MKKDIEKHRATRLAPRLRKKGYEYEAEKAQADDARGKKKKGGFNTIL